MGSSPVRTVVLAILLAYALLESPTRANTEEESRDFGPAATAAKLLSSPLAREQEEGEKDLRDHGESFRRTLVAGLASGDLREQAIVARLLRILVSPWVRGLEMGLNPNNVAFKPRRPVERPEAHPWASEIRKIALERLRALLKTKAATATRPKERAQFSYEEFEAANYLSLLLVEVGDGGTRDEIASLLSAERRDDFSRFLVYVLESLYGLPPFHEDASICGNASQEEFKKFTSQESARFQSAKTVLLAWHATHRAEPEEVRVKSVLSKHGPDLPSGWVSQWSLYKDDGLRCIRLGKAALPSIRERKARAARLTEKGTCEIFLAAVTGQADPALLRALFAGGAKEKALACEIVVWADSKEWKPELEAVLQVSAAPSDEPSRTAGVALAACHRKEALPTLKARFKEHPNAHLGDLIRRLEESAE